MRSHTIVLSLLLANLALTIANELGEACSANEDCTNIEHAFCPVDTLPENAKCICDPGYFTPQQLTNICILGAQFEGDPCLDNDLQCENYPGSVCQESVIDPTNKTCVCFNSTLIATPLGCLPTVDNLNDKPCESDEQCQIENSICSPTSSKCACNEDTHIQSNNACIPIATRLYDGCTEHIQCTTGLGAFAECSSDKNCQCKSEAVAYRYNRCFPLASLGDDCFVNQQCIDGRAWSNSTRCENRRCMCQHFELNGNCYRHTHVKGGCNADVECEAAVEGLTVCTEYQHGSRCECAEGYVPETSFKCIRAGQ